MAKAGHVYLRIPRGDRVPVPDDAMAFAGARCAHLQARAWREPVQYLVACAYLQALADVGQLMTSGRLVDANMLAVLRKEPGHEA